MGNISLFFRLFRKVRPPICNPQNWPDYLSFSSRFNIKMSKLMALQKAPKSPKSGRNELILRSFRNHFSAAREASRNTTSFFGGVPARFARRMPAACGSGFARWGPAPLLRSPWGSSAPPNPHAGSA